MSEERQFDGPFVEQVGNDAYRLTGSGFMYVTYLLMDGGYFDPEMDCEGFEVGGLWAGIMGSRMVDAADKYLFTNRGQDEADTILVALYAEAAKAEVEKQLPRREPR